MDSESKLITLTFDNQEERKNKVEENWKYSSSQLESIMVKDNQTGGRKMTQN